MAPWGVRRFFRREAEMKTRLMALVAATVFLCMSSPLGATPVTIYFAGIAGAVSSAPPTIAPGQPVQGSYSVDPLDFSQDAISGFGPLTAAQITIGGFSGELGPFGQLAMIHTFLPHCCLL